MSEIKEYQLEKELEELFVFLEKDLLASQTEIANGSKISRPIINQIFQTIKSKKESSNNENDIQSHNGKPVKESVSVSIGRNNLINLYNYIRNKQKPSTKRISSDVRDREKQINQAETYRNILKFLDSPDEFLLAGKYLPEKAMNVRVSSDIYPSMIQIATILELFPVEEALYSSIDFKSTLDSKLTTITNKLFSPEIFSPEKREEKETDIDNLINKMMKAVSLIMKEHQFPTSLTLEQRFNIQKKLLEKYSTPDKSQEVDYTKDDLITEIVKQVKSVASLNEEHEKIIKENLFQKYSNIDYLEVLSDKIMEEDTKNIPLGLRERIVIQEKLKKTHRKLKQGGKQNFTQQEALALFLSITVKEKVAKDLLDLSIRLEKLEYETLSLSLDNLPKKENFDTLYNKIFDKIAREQESKLAGTEPSEQKDNYNSAPVVLAKLTCKFKYKGEEKKLQFIYTSSNTLLENAISAVAVHLGFNQKLESVNFLSTKVINSQVNGLVEITVILKDGENIYQATWVDRDTIQAQIQAIFYAAIHWLSKVSHSSNSQGNSQESNQNQNIFDINQYRAICQTLSEIRTKLFDLRKKINNFQFLDEQCQDDKIEEISNKALHELKSIPVLEKENIGKETKQSTQKDIYLPFRKNLLRCYLHGQLILLRKANTQGDVTTTKNLLDEKINPYLTQYKEWLEGDLMPIQALLDIEQYLYEFSVGKGKYIDKTPEERNKELQDITDKIIKNIGHNQFYKDPGLDIHHCLAELYGNTARFNFYLSDKKEILEKERKKILEKEILELERKKILEKEILELEKAKNDFLTAAYHASRIGSNRRTAKWILFAGRVCIRLGDFDLAQEVINLSTTIICLEIHTQDTQIFKDALLSEIYLLRGEYELYRTQEKELIWPYENQNQNLKSKEERALYYFLAALKGSIYLGFSRRISDSLYNIFRCATKMEKTISSFLTEKDKNINPFVDYLDFSDDQISIKTDRTINPQTNPTSNNALILLNDLLENHKNDTWLSVAEKFLAEAQNIWQYWYSKDKDNVQSEDKHPVISRLESKEWLSVIRE